MNKVYRSVLVGLTIGVLLTIGLFVWFVKANESFIIDRVLAQLEEETTIQLTNDQLELSIWRHFPNVSLSVRDVLIPQPDNYRGANVDTMLFARKLYVNTDLIPLLLRRIQIKHIGIQEGEIHIKRDSRGKLNLTSLFLNEKGGSPGRRSPLKIDAFHVEDVLVTYYQESNSFYINHFIQEGRLSVLQTDLALDLSFQLTGNLQKIEGQNVKIDDSYQVTYKGILRGEKNQWEIRNGSVAIDGLAFSSEGIIDTDVPSEYEFVFSGQQLAASQVAKLLAKGGYQIPENIQLAKGEIAIQGRIEALRPRPQMQMTIDFVGEKLQVQVAQSVLNKGYVEGRVSLSAARNRYQIEIGKSHFQTMGGVFSGHLLLTQGRQRRLSMAFEGEMPLEALLAVVKPNVQVRGDGGVYLNYHYDGLFPQNSKDLLVAREAKISMTLQDNTLEFQQPYSFAFSNVTGTLTKDEHLHLDSLSGMLEGSNFLINAEMVNPEFLTSENQAQQTHLKGNIHFDSLNTIWFSKQLSTGASSKREKSTLFPAHLYGNVKCEVGTFEHRSFKAKSIELTLQYKPGMITLREVDMWTARGRVRAGGVLLKKADGVMSLRAQGNMNQLSIGELFRSMNNFGQDFLRDDHLGGRLSGDLKLQANLSKEGRIMVPSLKTHSKIRIEEGELIGFEPMMGLSKFIDVEELKHIRFSTLENQISIANQLIKIPQMDIHSSAFNITASGEHAFSHQFDYHVKVLLSEVFSSRLTKQKSKQEAFGAIEDDGLGNTAVYLQIEGTPDEYEVSYDRQAVRQVMKKRVEKEKKVLKEILNQEFGWFSKDTLKGLKEKNVEHRVEFENPPKTTIEKKETTRTRKKEKPLFNVVFEEDTTSKRK